MVFDDVGLTQVLTWLHLIKGVEPTHKYSDIDADHESVFTIFPSFTCRVLYSLRDFFGIILKCAPLISNSPLNINKNGVLKK